MKKEAADPFPFYPSSFILPPWMRSIAHISDIHFGKDDPPVTEALVKDLTERRPDLVICSGDLTQRARVGQFQLAKEFLGRLPTPQIVLAGNHDVPLFNVFRRIFTPMGRFRRLMTDNLMPVYRDDELLVVGLNTASRGSFRPNGFWKDGWVGKNDVKKAAVLLLGAPREVVKIVVTHHPFAPSDPAHAGDAVRNGRWVLSKMEDWGVDLLLGGHLHRAYHAHVEHGAISLQAGTAISTRRRHEPNSYNWLRVDAEKIELEVRVHDGMNFVAGKAESFKRFASVPGTPIVPENRPQMNTDAHR
jgi:3',5'-cyclic AMP phosphodiesterase CpdA